MSSSPQCAYIGLGAMGKSMAGHIAKKLESLNYPPLLAYNRTQARAEDLKKTHRVVVAESLEQVAQSADIIFSCLLNDAAVVDTVNSLKPYLKPNAILVESSTISPALAQKLAAELKQKNVSYIACPVVGPPVQAASGSLTVLIAGPEDARQQVLPLLDQVIGKKVINLGQDVGESLRLKLCANFFVTSVVEVVAEGMTLGEAAGVGQENVKELLDSLFPNTLFGIYAGRMLNNTYRDEIAFPISGAKKDVGHITEMAKENGVSLPVTEIFLQNANKVQEEQGNIDLSGIVGNLRVKAGLGFDLENKKEK
ncbi:NAD binding domain of 6-phosphogluconate dehydrogenase-domain-containing protein [Parasitella parasitica]|nr:NAD binding domain of 6-phosphogluconate dehydrogenase-domain-containing protein [Parasitella parasitica]